MLISLPPENRAHFRRLRDIARHLHTISASGTSDARRCHSYCLIRFYAVESGLKFLLYDREKIPHKHELADDESDDISCVESFGHDLQKMVKTLKVPARYAAKISHSFRLAGGYRPKGCHQSFSIAKAHEAWRYGLVIDPGDQTALETCLDSLLQWVENQLEGVQ